jgi:hypothetical protein
MGIEVVTGTGRQKLNPFDLQQRELREMGDIAERLLMLRDAARPQLERGLIETLAGYAHSQASQVAAPMPFWRLEWVLQEILASGQLARQDQLLWLLRLLGTIGCWKARPQASQKWSEAES